MQQYIMQGIPCTQELAPFALSCPARADFFEVAFANARTVVEPGLTDSILWPCQVRVSVLCHPGRALLVLVSSPEVSARGLAAHLPGVVALVIQQLLQPGTTEASSLSQKPLLGVPAFRMTTSPMLACRT
jgi:hypothetical protein